MAFQTDRSGRSTGSAPAARRACGQRERFGRRILEAALRCALAVGVWVGGSPIVAAADAGERPAEATVVRPGTGFLNEQLRRTWPVDAPAWDVGGDVRLRFEAKENAGTNPNRDFSGAAGLDNAFGLTRTKLHVGWHPMDWIQVYAEGRHSTVDARQAASAVEGDPMDLHQAWLQLGNPKTFPVQLKLGRQEMVYGDERLLGKADWSNVGRVFDAARVRWGGEGWWVEAFGGRQVVVDHGAFNVVNDYDWLEGLYFSSAVWVPWQDTEMFLFSRNVADGSPNALGLGQGGPSARDLYTPGLRFKSRPGSLGCWDYSMELAGQFGSIQSGGRRLEHRALAYDAQVGFTWRESWGKPRAGVGYTYGSGDDDPLDGRSGTFDLLFGTNHRLYGNMDVVGLRNLHSPSINLGLKPTPTLSLRMEMLGFWMAEMNDLFYPESARGRNANGYGIRPGGSSYVGTELDVIVAWQVASSAELQAGYGHFIPGGYIQGSVESNPANGSALAADWAYVSGRIRF